MADKVTYGYIKTTFRDTVAQYVLDYDEPEPTLNTRVDVLMSKIWAFVSQNVNDTEPDFITYMLGHGLDTVKERYELEKSDNKGVAWFWSAIQGFFREGIDLGMEKVDLYQSGFIGKIYLTVLRIFGLSGEDDTRVRLQKFVTLGVIDDDTADNIAEQMNAQGVKGNLMNFLLMFQFYRGWLGALMGAGTADFQKTLNTIFTPNIPNESDLIRNKLMYPDKGSEVDKKLAQLGYSDEDQKLIIDGARVPLDLGSIRILHMRELITDAEAKALSAQLGIDSTTYDQMQETWQVMPPVSDILWMMRKEAFEDDIIQKYGYDDELPSDAFEWGRKQGLSAEWVRKYWYAGWDAPSISQGYEMMHRKIITPSELNDLFKIIEIPPYWREKLIEMSYNVIGRVDLRRIYSMGVISADELPSRYEDMGYSPEDALIMTEWTIRNEQPNVKELTRTQIEQAYRYDQIDRSQAIGELVDLGYSEEDAETVISILERKEADKDITNLIKVIEQEYKTGSIDEVTAENELKSLPITTAKRTALLVQWNKTRRVVNAKLSKEDIKSFVEKQIIGPFLAAEELYRLGYNENQVRWFLTLWTGEEWGSNTLPTPPQFLNQ